MQTSVQWQLARDAAERYEKVLVPTILGPAAHALVEQAALRDDEIVLDIGCGTGAATRRAAELVGVAGRVTGIDVNAGMLAVARSLPPVADAVIDWQEAGACELPFADAAFDVVLCAQVLQFLDDRPRALAEMRRVLKPKGRVALSLWCDIRENPYFEVLVGVVAKHIGADTAKGLQAAFGLADAEEIRRLLADAGFGAIEVRGVQLNLDLPPPGTFAPRHIDATPMAAGFAAATPDAQQAVIRELSEHLAIHMTPAGMRVPFATHLAIALK